MGRRRTPGRLSDDDRALWERVASGATPLNLKRPVARDPAASRPVASPPVPAPVPAVKPPRPAAPVRAADALRADARVVRPEGRRSHPAISVQHAPGRIDRLAPTAAGIDRRTSDRMKRGEKAPDERIDLHGMTAERAHRALIAFIRRARAQGCRMVLVVTGKGGRTAAEAAFVPEGAGVLRHNVPRWLKEPPLTGLIVGVYAAHLRHGGEGALYVYLKRGR